MEKQVFIQKFINELDNFENIPEKIIEFSKKIDLYQFVNSNLKNLVNKKFFYPSNSSFNNFFIGESSKYIVNISYFIPKKNNSDTLFSFDSDTYLYSLQEESFKYKIYNQISTDPSVLNKELRLELAFDKNSSSNECLLIKRFSNVLQLDNSKALLVLIIRSKETLDYVWQYNLQTLKPEKIIASNSLINRLMATIKIMSQIGNSRSHEIIEELCHSEFHSVRWEALNALININYERGLFFLKRMANDSHPEIQTAAKNSLKKLNIKI